MQIRDTRRRMRMPRCFILVIEEEPMEKTKVHTPRAKTIAQVAEFLGVDEWRCAKAVDYLVEGKPVLVFIPGDRRVNEAKLVGYLGVPDTDTTHGRRYDFSHRFGARIHRTC